ACPIPPPTPPCARCCATWSAKGTCATRAIACGTCTSRRYRTPKRSAAPCSIWCARSSAARASARWPRCSSCRARSCRTAISRGCGRWYTGPGAKAADMNLTLDLAKIALLGASGALAAAARLAGVTRPVRLLRSSAVPVPATWGVRRPVIALPAAAATWTPERLRLVLVHELVHVRRQDVMVEALLWLAGALYWFHPAVRLERERACDEAVLSTGARGAACRCSWPAPY